MQVKEPTGRGSGGRCRTWQETKSGSGQGHHWLALGRAPGPGTLRSSLLWLSEHSCSSPGGRPHHIQSSQWGLGGDTVYMGKGGDENRRAGGGHSFYKASNGTKPTVETHVWPPTHKGYIKTRRNERSLELCMSISFEARFIINRVSQRTTEFPILCLTKPLKCK